MKTQFIELKTNYLYDLLARLHTVKPRFYLPRIHVFSLFICIQFTIHQLTIKQLLHCFLPSNNIFCQSLQKRKKRISLYTININRQSNSYFFSTIYWFNESNNSRKICWLIGNDLSYNLVVKFILQYWLYWMG